MIDERRPHVVMPHPRHEVLLGSHDLGVATFTAELFHAGMFPLIVFNGANAPTTIERFPRGEAVHYREHALELGVSDGAILVEPEARNTGDSITLTRALLESCGIEVGSVVLISRPYQQRRAYATCKKLWPEVDVICASRPLPLDEYIESIRDVDRVINMLVGDTQRITVDAERGFAIPQEIPNNVTNAYDRLVQDGFRKRLL
ncbi:YdcF family protein [Amycolatopsis keratiniphila]|uniref:YdcF family protein n=1 Tax=Amycolatopsis keratiniphila TaxID=129921 RepID=UPI0033CBD422